MVCATSQNDVRSWQNDVRAISDVTDLPGKMMCALMCALMCAPVAGVPVAQRTLAKHGDFSIGGRKVFPWGRGTPGPPRPNEDLSGQMAKCRVWPCDRFLP